MQHLEGSGTPVLYIGRTVLKRLSWNSQEKYVDSNREIPGTTYCTVMSS
jgi:hypothetical protein